LNWTTWKLPVVYSRSPMEPTAMILDKFLGLIIENRESSHWLKTPRGQIAALSRHSIAAVAAI
jgi:hypothetical protein